MADLTGVIRWNANFVRGLAQSVLDRAKVIRTSLGPVPSVLGKPARTRRKPKKAAKTGGRKKTLRAKRSDA